MRTEHLKTILAQSVEAGRGARAKNLKVYVRFFSNGVTAFEEERRQRSNDAAQNEFYFTVDGFSFFFDEWPWGIVVYHALEKDGTKQVEAFLKGHRSLRLPWITKKNFELLKAEFEDETTRIVLERSRFDPFEDYSGYGLSVQVSGTRSTEVMRELDQSYAIHPRRIGIETSLPEEFMKYDLTNTGRLSISSGSASSMFLVVSKYVRFLLGADEIFDFAQSRERQVEGVNVRETREMLRLKLPSIDKIKGDREKRNEAIIRMFTKNQETYGYVGIPLGPDRINILDLSERKILQVTIDDDEIFIFSENPSQVQSAIRRLVSKVATQIDPDVVLEKVNIGSS
jgi:hypothetical protein